MAIAVARETQPPVVLSPAAPPLLVTRDLSKSFRGLTALKAHHLAVSTGEVVGVIGPNGSGKSTFFNLVTGFLKPNGGVVEFAGREIQHLSPARIVRLGIARTFQGTRLFPGLSLRDNIRSAAQLRRPTGMLDAVLATPRLRRLTQEIEAVTDELLDLVNLTARGEDRASDLPYGDQRRLELMRALATAPRLLMLDEPAAGMDATETRQLLSLIDTIRHRYRLAVIVVEHDMDLIMNLCDRIQVLAYGEVIFEGTPAEVQTHPRVREVYLGHG